MGIILASCSVPSEAQCPQLNERAVLVKCRNYTLSIIPSTLELKLITPDGYSHYVSSSQDKASRVEDLLISEDEVTWFVPDTKLWVCVSLQEKGIDVSFESARVGAVTFPVVYEQTTHNGWILPMFEGIYVDRKNEDWRHFLCKSRYFNTTSHFTLPFISLRGEDFTSTYIFENQFNNLLEFSRCESSQLRVKVTHEFNRNQLLKQYKVLYRLGDSSPITPAEIYRATLLRNGQFVSLRQKINQHPNVEKLIGAPHFYLWGSPALCVGDVYNWRKFVTLLRASEGLNSPQSLIWSKLSPTSKIIVMRLCDNEWIDGYSKKTLVDNLNTLLFRGDLWKDQKRDVVEPAPSTSALSVIERNSAALFEAFPGCFDSSEEWGDGLSLKFLEKLKSAGLDRAWLGCANWFQLREHPKIVNEAKRRNFLVAPYDSYNGIHPSSKNSAANLQSWETTQFDSELFRTGAIVNAKGRKIKGYKGIGFALSPIAVKPYVEKRVSDLISKFQANSWFVDCDGFGEYFDDYSMLHPSTQEADMKARIARLEYIRDKYGLVVGSEGCSPGFASTLHFSHGVLTPYIGNLNKAMQQKHSKYFLGAYYPPERPELFFKQVALSPTLQKLFFDPACRLPLFQTVFHDSIVATHHWEFGSYKISGLDRIVEQLELFYNIPPLYHMNVSEFEKRQERIARNFRFFSRIHRITAFEKLTEFQWITNDRLVQKIRYGKDVELLSNFSEVDYGSIPRKSVVYRNLSTGELSVFSL